MGSSSGAEAGTVNAASTATGSAPGWVIAMTGPRRARISSIVETFLANSSSRGITTIVGVSAAISASGPCFSSEAG